MPTKRFLITLFVTYILSACTGNAVPTTAADDNGENTEATAEPTQATELNFTPVIIDAISPPSFTLHSESPVLARGRTWDNTLISPGAVVFHDGILHMFYFGSARLENEPPLKSVGYAVSLDGYVWQRAQDEPVEFTGEPDYKLAWISVSSILVSDEGIWVMYFSSNANAASPTGGFIGRATAPAPTGPWTIDDAPVLLPGNPARWDGGGVGSPAVIATEEGFQMYFSGTDGDQRFLEPTQIGMATSPDGLTWTKYNDPDTTGRRYEDSDPVLKVADTGAWDSTDVSSQQVLRTTQGWVMLYIGSFRAGLGKRIDGLGFATSADGIVWERHKGNPVFLPEEVLPNFFIGFPVWLYHENQHFLYFGAYDQTFLTWEIYLATSE